MSDYRFGAEMSDEPEVYDITPTPILEADVRRGTIEAAKAARGVEAQVLAIVEVQLGGYYDRSVEGMIAQAWGASGATVRTRAAEASRLIRRGDMNEKIRERRERQLQFLGRIQREALEAKEFNTAVRALEVEAKISGTMIERHLVNVEHGNGKYKGWTRDELKHFGATGERPPRLGSR